jgi:tripartite-type tricarboxylate transporter receptor subunit TctC
MAPMANGVNLVREGKLAGLAVSSGKRDILLPDLPTVSESGVPGYESILWFGLLTSSAVPRPIVNKLNAEITRILRSAETYERFAPIGMTPRPMSAEDFDAAIRNDVAVFTRIAREANIKAE